MNDYETLCRAKMYIDKLANGINPLTDEPVSDDDVVNNVRISRCLFYVSGVLERVITNGISSKKVRNSKLPFFLSEEDLKKIECSDTPIAISAFVRNINSLIDDSAMKKLSYRAVQSWLNQEGYLEEAGGRYQNTRLCPTELGRQVGITVELRVSANGNSYYVVYYNAQAQALIIENLSEILKLQEQNSD